MEAKGERERKGRNWNKMKRRLFFPYSVRKILWITINLDIFFNFIFLYGGLRTFFLILYIFLYGRLLLIWTFFFIFYFFVVDYGYSGHFFFNFIYILYFYMVDYG